MNCLKCGREIPDGTYLCPDCAQQPDAQSTQHFSDRPDVRSAQRIPAQPDAQSTQYFSAQPDVRPSAPPPERPEPRETPKRTNILLIPLIAVSALFLAACILCISMVRSMTVQRNSFRIKEADFALRESQISGLRQSYDDLKTELDRANATITEQSGELTSLREELHDRESSASQQQYDAESAQQSIRLLTEEKNRLADENEALNETLSDLGDQMEEQIKLIKDVQDELDEMSKKYKAAKEKSDFMDTYIVFVNNNGSNLYHTFDCRYFTKSNFWAYSRKLAENYGYSPCPDCCG